jgi:hypothetical protein
LRSLPPVAVEEPAPLPRAWLASVLAAFVVVHAGASFEALPLRALSALGSTTRAVAFYVLVGVVAAPLVRGLARVARQPSARALGRRSVTLAVPTFLVTSALVFPYRGTNGFVSLAVLYSRIARAPFAHGSSWLHKRLLLPALAWPLPADPRAYWALSLLVTLFGVLSLVLLTESWLERAGVDMQRPVVRLPLHVALATANPVIFSFQSPGYPDLLGLGLVWLAFALPLERRARASAIALAVIAHEGVLFAALPLAAVASSKEERRLVFSVAAAYGLAWLSTASVALRSITELQLRPDHSPAWVWLAAYPERAALGVVMAFKALWAIVAATVARALRDGERRFAVSVLVVVGAPLLLLPLTVDTSRLAGFGVAGVVACLARALHRAKTERRWRAFTWAAVVATALWPSTYVALNEQETVFDGVHAVLRRGELFVE